MIRFFPSPYPDESIYSLFVRYSKQVGNKNAFSSIRELLGKMHLRVNLHFAGNLDYMCSLFPDGVEYSPEYFIDSHTILPLYKPFVPWERYDKAVSNLKFGSLSSVYSGLGITAGAVLRTAGIKYCPICINEDREQYGEAFLHRTHQIQGVFTCTKHNSLLRVADTRVDNDGNFFDIEQHINSDIDENALPSLYDEILKLSFDVDFLMNNFNDFGDMEVVFKKYNTYLHEKDFVSASGLVNQVKIQKAFLEFYSGKFLDDLQSQVISDESNWLRIITRKKIKAVDPIRHLIFIRFLFGSVNNFIQYTKTDYMPFSEPPYPCMNCKSEHYKKLLIKECFIKTNHHTSKAIGTFKCPQCQFIYTINADDYSSSGFEKARAKNQRSLPKVEGKHLTGQTACNSELEEKYTKEMTDLLEKEPNLSRRGIIKVNSKAYRWLYKHKREWLESRIQSPKKQKDFYKNTRVNWSERDKYTLEKVKGVIKSIFYSETPLRISIMQIAKVINYGALSRDMNKMPLTSSFLKSIVESVEQFHKRKIDSVIKRMIIEERKLIKHVILREAGISDKFYHDYDKFIEEKIKTNT